jgi:hypothetical protein
VEPVLTIAAGNDERSATQLVHNYKLLLHQAGAYHKRHGNVIEISNMGSLR